MRKKNILTLLLISTILSGCKKEESYYLSDVLNNYRDNTFVDEYLNKDSQTRGNVTKLEKDLDKYYDSELLHSKQEEIVSNMESYGIDTLKNLINYTLKSELCDNLNIDFDSDIDYDIKYIDNYYLITQGDNKVIINKGDSLFDLVKYSIIYNNLDVKNYVDSANIFKESLDIVKDVIIGDTYIDDNNEMHIKSLKK